MDFLTKLFSTRQETAAQPKVEFVTQPTYVLEDYDITYLEVLCILNLMLALTAIMGVWYIHVFVTSELLHQSAGGEEPKQAVRKWNFHRRGPISERVDRGFILLDGMKRGQEKLEGSGLDKNELAMKTLLSERRHKKVTQQA